MRSLPLSGGGEARRGPHLGQFPEVLGCGSEVELIFCSVGTAETQAVQLQDPLEMREEHLDLLSLAA